ncbi:MAG: endonuclease [Gammaproteobacteria bacterium]|nr:endonuclease [Gammaproteobacteria bacterium]
MPLILLLILTGLLPAKGIAATPQTFSQAKKIISSIYSQNPVSFYCNCLYNKVDGKLKTDLKSCGYTARKNAKRAARIEWEHVVPAWWLGHQRQCWKNGGRRNCRKTDPVFRRAEADLMNLVPAVGEVNGDRSNYRFGIIEGEARRYGQCDMEIDFKQRVAEPTLERRGDIARTYFYMSNKYNIKLSPAQQKMFTAWDLQDPESAWEKKRKLMIEEYSNTSRQARLKLD